MTEKKPKVLIVDDEVGIRELLGEILFDEGFAIDTAENAEAAWEKRLRGESGCRPAGYLDAGCGRHHSPQKMEGSRAC